MVPQHHPSMVVSDVASLRELVAICKSVGAFAFDVETRGNIERHSDVVSFINAEWKAHISTLKSKSPEVAERSRGIIEDRWRKTLALDPLRNEVFWIGIATTGHSWAIPMGHRHGEMLTPPEIGDGSTVPPEGYRKILPSGKTSSAKDRYYIPATFSKPPSQLSKSEVFTELSALFTDPTLVKIGHNVKFDARSVRKYLDGVIPAGPYRDTMVMQHIINENLQGYSLEALIAHNFGKHSAYAKDGKLASVIDLVGFDTATRYVHLDARWTWLLHNKLLPKISSQVGLMNALDQDMATDFVIMHMEDEGIPVAQQRMKELGKSLDLKMRQIQLDMSKYTPAGFNPDSVVSKRALLFSKKSAGGLGLKPKKLTPGGQASVDIEMLEAFAGKHPMIDLLLEWSDVKKLKSTFVDGLLVQLNNDRLHPSFHLHRTTTGRLSSSNPNLQNIPRSSEVRSLFVAPEGYKLLVFDYDQIELRIMCMFSHDSKMSEFFLTGADIHAGAAALCLGKPLDEITAEDRQLGKGVNFLTAYGGGPAKLAATTGITLEHAQYVIASYYKQFSGITKWKRTVIATGVSKGYVSTLSGRRRRLPDLLSNNTDLRSKAERQAVNAVVQGSAADICKIAMIDTFDAFESTGAKLLVQVHDELLAMCPEDEVDKVIPLMRQAMGDGRIVEGIPLKVSGAAAYSWAGAKGK